ncbi:MAG: hypothetical protein JXA13_17025 [Anaerolineales bacterium]|nr:hypothetical protein [Anaerolineales bacterium]
MISLHVRTLLRDEAGKRIVLLAAVSFIVFVVYVLCPVTTSTDSRWTPYIAMSILREKNVNLDEYVQLMEDQDYRVFFEDGHIYSYFPLSVPLISVPYFWILEQYFNLRYSIDFSTYLSDYFPNATLARYEMFAASFVSALAAGIFFLMVSRRLSLRQSLLLTFLFAFSTPMLSTASRALWQHGFSVLFLVAAMWLALEPAEKPGWYFTTGLLLGLSYVIRPTNSIAIVFFSLYLLVNHRKQLAAYGFGLCLPVVALVLNSLLTYQTLLPEYFQPQRLDTNKHFWEGLLANIVSPNRGLFIVSPILLFSLVGIYLQVMGRKMSWRKIDIYLVFIVCLHWIAISSFDNWYGGWSLGPRLFTDMTPFLVYLMIPVLEGRLLRIRSWQAVFGFLLLFSTLVHFRYATSYYPMMWNGKPTAIVQDPKRVWDVTDLQFLRGYCDDKLEGPAPQCWFESEVESE